MKLLRGSFEQGNLAKGSHISRWPLVGVVLLFLINVAPVQGADPWMKLAAVPQAREAGAAAAANDGRIYLIGGITGYTAADHSYTGVKTDRVDAFDPRSNTWSTVTPLPVPRASFAAATGGDGRVYVVGGYTG